MSSMRDNGSRFARRSFLTRLGAGVTAFGAGAQTAGAQSSQPPRSMQSAGAPSAAGHWEPTRHAEDDWFDQPSARHRFFFDTTNAVGFGEAIIFANNFFTANKAGYGLAEADLSVVICARHQSTAFAFSDAMWAKYAAPLADRASFMDPKTKLPAIVNVFQATGYEALLTSRGVALDVVLKKGARLAVCQMATRACAATIAGKMGGTVDGIYKELTEHLVPNAHMVPAGIVAVNRAQEHGYAFAYAG